jgi:hypothetical protein
VHLLLLAVVTDRRWKAMPAERMLDDLAGLQERWGFDVVRFHDANFGVLQKRTQGLRRGHARAATQVLVERLHRDALDPLVQARSARLHRAVGHVRGRDRRRSRHRRDDEAIGKPIHDDDNIAAAVEMDKRGVCASVTYIIGYPGERPDSMLATIDPVPPPARRLPARAPDGVALPADPGHGDVGQAIALGYEPPRTLQEWGSIGEYHLEETWPGKIPPERAEARACSTSTT